MSEYQIIQFEGCSCVVIAPEDIEAKDTEIADPRKRLAESERVGERLGELLSDWQHWYREDAPRMTRMQLEAKTDSALAEWRARK